MKGLVVAKDSTTAYTPRAHGVNPLALGKAIHTAALGLTKF